jgi:hypothetical protein
MYAEGSGCDKQPCLAGEDFTQGSSKHPSEGSGSATGDASSHASGMAGGHGRGQSMVRWGRGADMRTCSGTVKLIRPVWLLV